MRRIILIVALILLILFGIYFIINSGKIPNPFQRGSSLGGQIFNKTQNPISGKIPEINPLDKTRINPFKNIYPNPFDRVPK